jgi:acyl-homoserine lactone acylase PvdQ
MQNNNVSPDTIVLEGNPIKPDDYPRYIFDDFRSRANARGVRSSQVLSAAYDFGVDDAINLALDEKWVATEIWQAALKYVATANADVVDAEDDTYREFLSALLGFDGFATKESSAALKYYYWREALWSSIEINDIVAMLEAQGAGGSLSREMQTAFLSGIDAAMAAMLEDYGSMDLVLGDVFRITRGQGDWPLGGAPLRPRLNASYWDYRACSNLHPLLCENTLRAYQFGRADEEGKRMAVSGSRLLRLVSFTDPIKSFTAFNYGQSDVASSPHFDDQAEKLSSARQLKAVYFEFDDLASHVSSHDRLSTSSAN